MSINSAVRATKLDKIFGTPVCAVLLAILCNILWGSAFPFIKLGYRLFSIDPAMSVIIAALILRQTITAVAVIGVIVVSLAGTLLVWASGGDDANGKVGQ